MLKCIEKAFSANKEEVDESQRNAMGETSPGRIWFHSANTIPRSTMWMQSIVSYERTMGVHTQPTKH